MTMPITPVDAVPLHQKIRSDIERRILDGSWAPGHRIPFEHELMVRYGCSRMTVNKALAAMAEAGLIVRRRRVGSFVAQPRIQSAVLDIPDIQASIIAKGHAYGIRLISRRSRPANGKQPEEREFGKGTPLLFLTCVHLADQHPFALEERMINLTIVPDATTVDFASEPPGTWLLHHVAWTKAEHRISAINANDKLAKTLEVTDQTACLMLERRTWRNGNHITFVRQTFPGAAYDLVARFAPQSG